MELLNLIFHKKHKQNIKPLPSWDCVVETMYDKHLDAFADKIVKVMYSKDRSMRYVILKDEKGLYTYQLEAIYQYDENEWQYICSDNEALPAMWEPYRGFFVKSVFENIDDLLRDIESEPEYKIFF